MPLRCAGPRLVNHDGGIILRLTMYGKLVSAIQDFAGRQERGKEEPETDRTCSVAPTETANSVILAILDPLVSQPELEQALHVRSLRTRRLLEHFNTLATRNELRPASTQDLQSRCLKYQTEVGRVHGSNRLV